MTRHRHVRNSDLPFIKKNWIGNRVHKGQFVNRNLSKSVGIKSVAKWRFSPNPQFKEKFFERWKPNVHTISSLDSIVGDNLIWLGHNSFYMSVDGKRMMFDPVFGSIYFVKRRSPLPADPSVFKDIDYLMLSHDHFDHLDKRSVKRVCRQSPNIIVLCGMGMEELLARWLPNTKIVPMAWYQQYQEGSVKFTFLPSNHWSKRSAKDGGKRLWGAFVVESYSKTIYYSGDTGYGDHFKELPNLFGKIDYALIGIGAYKPRWLMERNHISPYEALDAAVDMGATVTIPMHYGTFSLSDEPMSDPPRVFRSEALRRNISHLVPDIGESVPL